MENPNNAIENYKKTRLILLEQITLDDLIASRSYFWRSGELTHAAEIIFHVFDEYFSEKQGILLNALMKKQTLPAPNLFSTFEELEFQEERKQKLNSLLAEFTQRFCINGRIDWASLAV